MKTILFDLDGTLLPIGPDRFRLFLEDYLRLISGYCAHLVEPKKFAHTLLAATEMMVRNDGARTNEEVFMSFFLPALGLERAAIYPVLEEFYRTEFSKLSKHTEPTGLAGKIVEAALAKGWRVALATNPVFPRIAIEERMAWAGISEYPWCHVTSYEESRGCKPSLVYYRQLVDKLGLEPRECWMIGNDRDEDMIAGALGFKTYLLTDHALGEGAAAPPPTEQGTIGELFHYINEKM